MKIEKQIKQLEKSIGKTVSVNSELREELTRINEKIENITANVGVKNVIVKAEDKKDEDLAATIAASFQKSVEAVSSASRQALEKVEDKYSAAAAESKEALEAMQKEITEIQRKIALAAGSDDRQRAQEKAADILSGSKKLMVEFETKFTAFKKDMEQKLNKDYQQEIALLKKDLQSSIVKQYQQVAEGLENNLEVLQDKFGVYRESTAKNWGALEVRVQNLQQNVAAMIANKVDKLSASLKTEIVKLDKEYAALKKTVAQLRVEDKEEAVKQEPVGIIVTRTFEKSLVLISADNGSFVFNPYKNFTGIIRVRNSSGAEKIIRVPYTGDYLKVSDGVVDSGPFARNCAQGINCNLDVRGSLSGKVRVE